MSEFNRGDRVRVVDYQVDEAWERDKYVGRYGSVLANEGRTSFVTVELDDDDGSTTLWYPEELAKISDGRVPISQDELNHERAHYEATIDNLNEVLDEIQDMVGPGSNSRVSSDSILKVLSKRPELV